MVPKNKANILETTASLSKMELLALIKKSDYISSVTIESPLEQDFASFEGGDTWVFNQYNTKIEREFKPTESNPAWANTSLTLPGYKQSSDNSLKLTIGKSYIVFYEYSAMADGYSLEGLLYWNEDTAKKIEQLVSTD